MRRKYVPWVLGRCFSRLSTYQDNMTTTFVEYLTQTVSPQFTIPLKFELVILNTTSMFKAVEGKTIDFLFVDPSTFACLEAEFQVTAMLSLKTSGISEYAGVIIARANDSRINKLEDIRGKIVGGRSKLSFGSMQTQWYELENAGVHLFDHASQVRLSFSDELTLNDVRSSAVDVGFVRSGLLESLNATEDFKIIHARNHTSANGKVFPYVHSTELYPQWVFGALKETSKDFRVEEIIVFELENITEIHPAAQRGNYDGWIPTLSYFSVHTLQDTLNLLDLEGHTYKCRRSDDVVDSISCPRGYFLKGRDDVLTACSYRNLGCPSGYNCLCSPCREADNVEIFSPTGGTCKKMQKCKTIEQKEQSFLTIRDNLKRGLPLRYILHVPTSDSSVESSGDIFPNVNFTYNIPFSIFKKGDTVIEFFFNGTQIDQSPILFRVVEKQCGENEKASEDGDCEQTKVTVYLPNWQRNMGMSLFTINCFMSVVLFIWTLFHWSSRIIRAAQPIFLALVLVGCITSSATLIPLSMDDRDYSQETMDSICQGKVWLYGIGFALSYSALFAKTFRVKQVTLGVINRKNMVVRSASQSSVWWYMGTILATIVIETLIIGTWMGVSPLVWKRSCVSSSSSSNSDFCESVGHCSSEHGVSFAALLLSVHLLLLVFVLIICYQVRNVPAEFAEHKWITAATVSSIEILVLTPPFIALTWSTKSASTLIAMFAIFFNDLGVLVMVFIPKIVLANSKFTKEDQVQEDILHKLRIDVRANDGVRRTDKTAKGKTFSTEDSKNRRATTSKYKSRLKTSIIHGVPGPQTPDGTPPTSHQIHRDGKASVPPECKARLARAKLENKSNSIPEETPVGIHRAKTDSDKTDSDKTDSAKCTSIPNKSITSASFNASSITRDIGVSTSFNKPQLNYLVSPNCNNQLQLCPTNANNGSTNPPNLNRESSVETGHGVDRASPGSPVTIGSSNSTQPLTSTV
ncbi:hypothetical protein AAMO2058_001674900 [Amorphochlora amoebiformis]